MALTYDDDSFSCVKKCSMVQFKHFNLRSNAKLSPPQPPRGAEGKPGLCSHCSLCLLLCLPSVPSVLGPQGRDRIKEETFLCD